MEVRRQPQMPAHAFCLVESRVLVVFPPHMPDWVALELLGILQCLPSISLYGYWDYRHMNYVSHFYVLSGSLNSSPHTCVASVFTH